MTKRADVLCFVSILCARRTMRTVEHEHERLTLNELIRVATKSWHGVQLNRPDWGDSSHTMALTVELKAEGRHVHLMFNAYATPLEFELPNLAGKIGGTWRRWIDTALESPQDIVPWDEAPPVSGGHYHVQDRSVVVLAT